MDSLARAREVVIACGWTTEDNPDVPFDNADVQRIATAIDEARLEEAKWQLTNLIDPWAFSDSEVGKGARKRIAELEASIREGGKV